MAAKIIFKTLFKKNLQKTIGNCISTSIRHHDCWIPSIVMNNGEEMPILGFGTFSNTKEYRVIEGKSGDDQQASVDKAESKNNPEVVAKAVGIAINAGFRSIDGAHLYQNEKEIGKVLKKKMDDGVLTRESLFYTSKLWNTFHDPENVCPACVTSLENLGLDYLDLYLMHTPMGFQYGDDLFPVCCGEIAFSDVDYIETWEAMEDLVEKKLCRSIGISNFTIDQIDRLLKNCKIVPQNLQIEVHPYLTQKELIKYAKCHDISVTAYSPVGAPKRSWADQNERVLLEDYKILQLAEKHQRTPAQILLRYQIQMGNAAIPKSLSRPHIQENINIFDFELCPEDMDNIDSLNHNQRYYKFSGSFGHPHHPYEREYISC